MRSSHHFNFMEPTFRHLPLIDHASGIRNLDAQRRLPAVFGWRHAIAWLVIGFTIGLLTRLFF
jgi:hypothetical protein